MINLLTIIKNKITRKQAIPDDPAKKIKETFSDALSKVNPITFKESIIALTKEGISFTQYNLIVQAIALAETRQSQCPFCQSTKTNQSGKCWWCLREIPTKSQDN
jgi:hypothetical protein